MSDTDFHSEILELSRRRIAVWEAQREDWNTVKTLSKLLDQAKREYEERFLYELIQNGYDAHDREDREGEVAVAYDSTEGDGVVYVANKGNPFELENVKSISDLADSSKDPRESIGNKGVGFKSVLRVCEWPEIYSARPGDRAGESFEGFCFSFARRKHVLELVDGSEERTDQVLAEVSPYFLPVPLHSQPERVKEFARDGMSTVIRLPLRGEAACDVARRRIEELITADVPVQLFLDRLWLLSVDITADGEELSQRVQRVRVADPIPSDSSSIDEHQRHETVDLDEQGRWFLAKRAIPAQTVEAAIKASIEEGQIDSSWEGWDQESEVAVAVRLDGSQIEPREYTYLPMGEEAVSPFHGHLHAPFSTKLARTTIDTDVPYNRLLLEQAVEAAVRGLLAFADNPGVLPSSALLDLFAWDEPYHEFVESAFESLGADASTSKVIPIVSVDGPDKRGQLDSVYAWSDAELSLAKAELVVEAADAELLEREISEERVERLEAFSEAVVDGSLEPDDETRAEWLGAIARLMHSRDWKPGSWDRFYGDVSTVMEDSSEALRGRQLLLGGDGKLHVVPTDDDDVRTLVFFPPARGRTDSDEEVEPDSDVGVPRTLETSLIQMHDGLRWTRRDGRRTVHTGARRFFEDERLIRGYKAADLLEHIGDFLDSRFSAPRARDALSYAFRIQRAARSIAEDDLKRARLRVPTDDGWIDAALGIFSPEWGTPLAKELDQLIADETANGDLRGLRDQQILPPGGWQHPPQLEEFVEFLRRIGVRDGLHPSALQTTTSETIRGLETWPRYQADNLGLSEDVLEEWQEQVEQEGEKPSYMSGRYRLVRPVSTLAGLQGHDELSPRAKERFARLVVSGLGAWDGNPLILTWLRGQGESERLTWPSPLATALRETPWIPLRDPDDDEGIQFVRPGEAWHASEAQRDVQRFSPLIAPVLRKQLEMEPGSLDVLTNLGLRLWSDPQHAAALLSHLADIVGAGRTGRSTYAMRREAEDAWKRILAVEDNELPSRFVVTRSGRLGGWGSDDAENLLIDTGRSRLLRSIIDATDRPLLVADPSDGEAISRKLTDSIGPAAAVLSSLDIHLVAEGEEIVPLFDSGSQLVSEYSWLREVVALVLETSRFVRFGPEMREQILRRLELIRVRRLAGIELYIEGVRVQLPSRFRSVLPVADEVAPTFLLVEATDVVHLSDLSSGLADLLEAPPLVGELQNALLRLERTGADEPTAEAVAEALDIDLATLEEVRANLGRSASDLARRLAPIVVIEASIESARKLIEVGKSATSDAEVERAIDEILGSDERARQLVQAGQEAATSSILRELLGLDFVDFNSGLSALGEPVIRPTEDHERAVRYAIATEQDRILEDLRRRWLARFRSGEDLAEYVQARLLDGIEPDPDWLDLYAVPPADVLKGRIDQWLTRTSGPESGDPAEKLKPLEDTRRHNQKQALKVFLQLRPRVHAWCSKQGLSSPEEWGEAQAASLAETLNRRGLLDFDWLDEDGLVRQVARAGLLPSKMAATLDLKELDLTQLELEDAEKTAAKKADEQVRRERRISIDNKEFIAAEDSFGGIANAVRQELGKHVLAGQARMATLAELPDLGSRSSGGGGGGNQSNRRRGKKLSKEQTEAIGFVGEVVAGEWLAHHYSESFHDGCWMSSYRSVDGAPPGDDDLGYDFRVSLKSMELFFEVKATTGDAPEFDLGNSQVKFARACVGRGSGNKEFRVLFVTHVLDSRKRRVDWLPNPMDPKFRDYYRFPGSGLTCAFRPAD